MKISIIRPSELGKSQIINWNNILQSEPLLASPYFSPSYTLAAGECISDVFVAILEDNSKEIGYFPFQLKSKFIGGPVGGRLSDYQSVIIKSDAEWDAALLIKECGLAVWDFDHLLASQEPFYRFHQKHTFSPIMDISEGFDAYCTERKRSGVKRISNFLRKDRKMKKELENLRFIKIDDNLSTLEQVFVWKSEQCKRTGVIDYFNYKWARELVERIFCIREDGFSGLLSAIYHDDKIIAAHMGMRTSKVLHYWFPTYNNEYNKYSPGGVLLLQLAREMAVDNLDYIDLGKGDDSYKSSFANAKVDLAEGSVMIPSLRATVVKTKRQFVQYLRESTILRPAKHSYKYVRGLFN